MGPLASRVLSIAATQVGVREHGRNRGPEVDGYWRDIGWDAGGLSLAPVGVPKAWCAVFVSAMVKRAADALGVPVPIHLAPGVFSIDEKSPAALHRKTPAAGSIFIKNDHEHTGFVVGVRADGTLDTIEGNTNAGGSAEGDGVYQRARHASEIMGYLDLNLVPA